MPCYIDIHHHFFPPDFDKKNASLNVGWRTPKENLPWTPELSIKAMDSLGIRAAVLSFPASPSAENQTVVRKRNDYVAGICRKYPDRFGFFASLPYLDNVQGIDIPKLPKYYSHHFVPLNHPEVLDEITYAFDVIGADGVSMSSSYGEGTTSTYVGDDKYDTIWAELARRKAVVFIHGNAIPSSVPWPHPVLGLPVSEVPNETFKAAAHLVVTGRKRRYPDVKIILAHLGGSTPFLASRVAILSHYMGCKLTPEEILEDFRSFYYDTALSAWGPNLAAMDSLVPPTHILFGTDFPAVSKEMSGWYTRQVESHYGAEQPDEEKLQAIGLDNALRIFPKLRERFLTPGAGTVRPRRMHCLL